MPFQDLASFVDRPWLGAGNTQCGIVGTPSGAPRSEYGSCYEDDDPGSLDSSGIGFLPSSSSTRSSSAQCAFLPIKKTSDT